MDSSQISVFVVAVITSVAVVIGLFLAMRRFVNPGMLLLGLPLPAEIDRLIGLAKAEERTRSDVEVALLRQEYANSEIECKRAIAELTDRVEWLMQLITERKLSSIPVGAAPAIVAPVPYRKMLVAVGDDPGLKIDLGIFRRIQVGYERLNPVTLTGFEKMINRAKRAKQPFLYIHLAAHTTAAGSQFADGLATPEWLSERVDGVKVMLIAGCESTEIGDWLGGIAEYVITMAEPVSAGRSPALSDIGLFSEAFWAAIYDGNDPQTAFYAAIEASPSWIGEIANIHAGVRR